MADIVKRGVGRPQHVPTDKTTALVAMRARLGLPHDMIAAELRIATCTLRKHYREVLDVAEVETTAAVSGALYSLAVGDRDNGVLPDRVACMFWLKCRAGWKDVSTHEHTGINGGPIELTAVPRYDIGKLSDHEQAKLLDMMNAIEIDEGHDE